MKTLKELGYIGPEKLMNPETGSIDTAENWFSDMENWSCDYASLEDQFFSLVLIEE